MNTRFIKSGNWHRTLSKGLKFAQKVNIKKGVKLSKNQGKASPTKKS